MSRPTSFTSIERLRRATAGLIGLVLAGVVLTACGSSAAAGGGGGGGANSDAYAKVLSEAQGSFGNTMVAGSVEGDTLKITLAGGSGAAMAKLFLCSNIKGFMKDAGIPDAKVSIIEEGGAPLVTEKDCH